MNKKSAFFFFFSAATWAVFVDETANSSILKVILSTSAEVFDAFSTILLLTDDKVHDLSTYPVSNTTIYTIFKHMNIVLLRSVSSNLEGLLRNMHLSSNHSEQVGMWDKLR